MGRLLCARPGHRACAIWRALVWRRDGPRSRCPGNRTGRPRAVDRAPAAVRFSRDFESTVSPRSVRDRRNAIGRRRITCPAVPPVRGAAAQRAVARRFCCPDFGPFMSRSPSAGRRVHDGIGSVPGAAFAGRTAETAAGAPLRQAARVSRNLGISLCSRGLSLAHDIDRSSRGGSRDALPATAKSVVPPHRRRVFGHRRRRGPSPPRASRRSFQADQTAPAALAWVELAPLSEIRTRELPNAGCCSVAHTGIDLCATKWPSGAPVISRLIRPIARAAPSQPNHENIFVIAHYAKSVRANFWPQN